MIDFDPAAFFCEDDFLAYAWSWASQLFLFTMIRMWLLGAGIVGEGATGGASGVGGTGEDGGSGERDGEDGGGKCGDEERTGCQPSCTYGWIDDRLPHRE